MSHCERFPQIAQNKWATVSESLRSLMSKERPWANRSGRSWQMSDSERFAQVSRDKWANRSGRSPKMSHVSESLRSLTKNEQPWDIAQDAHQKWTNERIACFFKRIAQLLIFCKKRAICSENRWVNSQPWLFMTCSLGALWIIDALHPGLVIRSFALSLFAL